MELTTETTEKYPEFPQYLKIWQNYLYCSVPNSRKKGKPINEGKGEEREREKKGKGNNHFSIQHHVIYVKYPIFSTLQKHLRYPELQPRLLLFHSCNRYIYFVIKIQ